MFVQNLKRLNESEMEESQGVYDTLGMHRVCIIARASWTRLTRQIV